jgi:asparagine synthase (glutamine-hydrolysing)
MCGIAGTYFHSDKSLLESMLLEIKHRGPNHTGTFVNDKASIGMVRLSILDTSLNGNQPMISNCGKIVLVYNGEIYNYIEYRESLIKLGINFKSTTDTEVILNLYIHFGIDFLIKLNGMFSLAIYDFREKNKEKLYIARDRFGIKPLYYSKISNKFIFASELKAILKSGLVEKIINQEALVLLLKYGSVQQPNTLIEDVFMLKPGHYLEISNKNSIIDREYFNTNISEDLNYSKSTYEEQKFILDDLLNESIKNQIISDVPLGAFLSGGVDSSLIVALLSKYRSGIETFSVGFESESFEKDESEEAEKIANHFSTKHNSIIISENEVKHKINHIITSLDQPSLDGVNTYFVSEAASKNVKVALSGTGGDELFAGYPWFYNQILFDKNPLDYKSNIIATIASNKLFDRFTYSENKISAILEKYRSFSSFNSHFSRQHFVFSNKQLGSLLILNNQNSKAIGLDLSFTYDNMKLNKKESVLNLVSLLCMNGYLKNQLLRDIDVMSMTHSLEVRVPYLDNNILNFVLNIPDSSKIDFKKQQNPYTDSYRDLGTKKILIEVAKKYLPKDFDLQPKKGFSLPFSSWLKGSLSNLLDDVFSERSVKKRGIFSFLELRNLLENFRNNKAPWSQIWLIFVLELWFRENID